MAQHRHYMQRVAARAACHNEVMPDDAPRSQPEGASDDRLASVDDMLTEEQRSALTSDLRRISAQRRRGENAAARQPLGSAPSGSTPSAREQAAAARDIIADAVLDGLVVLSVGVYRSDDGSGFGVGVTATTDPDLPDLPDHLAGVPVTVNVTGSAPTAHGLTAPDDADPDRIFAPWTGEQVAALNRYQEGGWFHPFTCARCRDADERWPSPDEHLLVATNDGWACPTCDYTQGWAWRMMTEPPPAGWPSVAAGSEASDGA